jgi:hypothetical protein
MAAARRRLSLQDVQDIQVGARNLAFKLLFDEVERLRVVKPGKNVRQKHKILADEIEAIGKSILRPRRN